MKYIQVFVHEMLLWFSLEERSCIRKIFGNLRCLLRYLIQVNSRHERDHRKPAAARGVMNTLMSLLTKTTSLIKHRLLFDSVFLIICNVRPPTDLSLLSRFVLRKNLEHILSSRHRHAQVHLWNGIARRLITQKSALTHYRLSVKPTSEK